MCKFCTLKKVKGNDKIAIPHVKQPKPNNYENKNNLLPLLIRTAFLQVSPWMPMKNVNKEGKQCSTIELLREKMPKSIAEVLTHPETLASVTKLYGLLTNFNS